MLWSNALIKVVKHLFFLIKVSNVNKKYQIREILFLYSLTQLKSI